MPGAEGESPSGETGDGDDDAAPSLGDGPERDGCELVTAEDAEAILGEPVTEDDEATTTGLEVATCVWGVDQETSFKLLQFSLWEGAQFYGGDAFGDDESFEPVEGVGDEAFFLESFGLQFQARDGDLVVIIDVSGFNVDEGLDEDATKQKVIDLAKRVLAEV